MALFKVVTFSKTIILGIHASFQGRIDLYI